MGWFSSSTKPEDNEPTRQSRDKCWEARDSYFGCLDRVNVIKAGEEGSACKQEKKLYQGNCAKSWIEYFNQRRIIADAQKERLSRSNAQAENTRR